MDTSEPLRAMEKSAYRRAYSDGIIDLFVGLSLLWIGAAWVFLPDFAGFAGILPAVFTAVAVAGRRQYVERRLGYVRWSQPRRNQERRNLILLFGAGVVLLFAGVIAFVLVEGSLVAASGLDVILPGLLAWLLALLALGLAFMMESWRFVLYGIVLAVSGLITALQQGNPGWPLLVGGGVVGVAGATMLIAFSRSNPIPEGE